MLLPRAAFLVLRPTILRNFQRNLHHLREGVLPRFGVQLLAREGIVGNGADGQRVLAKPRRVQVQRSRLHLHRQHAQALQHLPRRRLRFVIENIRRVQRTRHGGHAELLGRFHRGRKQRVGTARRDVPTETVLLPEIAVRVRAHAQHDVAHFQLLAEHPRRADADL